MLPGRARFITLVILALSLSGAAFADSTVSMAFIGPGGTTAAEFIPILTTSPSITAHQLTDLRRFDNDVVPSETWTANMSGLLSGNGLWEANSPTTRKPGSFRGILSGNINATTGNWAIWDCSRRMPETTPSLHPVARRTSTANT